MPPGSTSCIYGIAPQGATFVSAFQRVINFLKICLVERRLGGLSQKWGSLESPLQHLSMKMSKIETATDDPLCMYVMLEGSCTLGLYSATSRPSSSCNELPKVAGLPAGMSQWQYSRKPPAWPFPVPDPDNQTGNHWIARTHQTSISVQCLTLLWNWDLTLCCNSESLSPGDTGNPWIVGGANHIQDCQNASCEPVLWDPN